MPTKEMIEVLQIIGLIVVTGSSIVVCAYLWLLLYWLRMCDSKLKQIRALLEHLYDPYKGFW